MIPTLLPWLRRLLLLAIPISIILTIYLYTWPLLHRCSYPNPTAPFRLLTLADPQLEGNTAINSRRYQSSHPVIRSLRSFRKQLDIWGNDYYLAHIYRSLYTFSDFLVVGGKPTHTVVLGDLVGSQWISDEEFNNRGQRYWSRIFPTAHKIAAPTGDVVDEDDGKTGKEYWKDKLINVAGNHDIGYAGDVLPFLVDRFEGMYGPSNYVFWHTAPNTTHRLKIVVLNDLHIDGPVHDRGVDLQRQTYEFLNRVLTQPVEKDVATVFLTHVPLFKEVGVCVDPPMVKFYEGWSDREGKLKEQNHISRGQSSMLLQNLFTAPNVEGEEGYREGIVLTGHDHEGCDVWHDFDKKTGEWTARVYEEGQNNGRGIREITVRSMMGEFGGNAGLTSAWWDDDSSSWKFQYSTCPLGIQHFWWAVHITDFITVVFSIAYKLIRSRQKAVRKKNVPKLVVTLVEVDDEHIKNAVEVKPDLSEKKGAI